MSAKILPIITCSILLILLNITFLPTLFANDNKIVFEYGESGHILTFPASKSDPALVIASITPSPLPEWNHSFEPVNSGDTFIFPMSEQEILEEKARREKLREHQDKFAKMQMQLEKGTEVFEMGESGHTIKFQWTTNQ